MSLTLRNQIRNYFSVAMLCTIVGPAATQIGPIRPPSAAPRGILITNVVPGSTAARARLQPGDVVTRVNNHRAYDLWDFVELLTEANGAAQLTVFDRNAGRFRTADVQPDEFGLIGVFGIATDQLAAYHSSVLLVTDVNIGSSAALAGLRRGDVILQVNGRRVPTALDFVRQFQFSGPIATITYVSGWDGSLLVAAVPAHPNGKIGLFLVPVPWN